jgi:hypothetical protein
VDPILLVQAVDIGQLGRPRAKPSGVAGFGAGAFVGIAWPEQGFAVRQNHGDGDKDKKFHFVSFVFVPTLKSNSFVRRKSSLFFIFLFV